MRPAVILAIGAGVILVLAQVATPLLHLLFPLVAVLMATMGVLLAIAFYGRESAGKPFTRPVRPLIFTRYWDKIEASRTAEAAKEPRRPVVESQSIRVRLATIIRLPFWPFSEPSILLF